MSTAKNNFARLPAACFLLVVFAQICFSQTAPQVLKVDPPSWWVRHSLNPVRLLIHGKNLQGARVQPLDRGVKFGVEREFDRHLRVRRRFHCAEQQARYTALSGNHSQRHNQRPRSRS